MLPEKKSHSSSSSGQCVHSGQTGMSQEVFLATPKLLCNRGTYWTTSNSYGFWHTALHTFCSLWPQRVPGVHGTLTDNPKQPHCVTDKQWLVIVQTQLHQWSGSAVSHPPLAIPSDTEVETYRLTFTYLSTPIHLYLYMFHLSLPSHTHLYNYTHRNIH